MITQQHAKFLDRLRASEGAVVAVAEWARRLGETVEIPTTRFAPTAADADNFVDDGDLFITNPAGIRRRVEVKQISRPFSGADDWPFLEVFVSNARAVDRAGDQVAAYVTVNRDLSTIAVVTRETRPNWYLRETRAGNTGNVEKFYACPTRLAMFYHLRTETMARAQQQQQAPRGDQRALIRQQSEAAQDFIRQLDAHALQFRQVLPPEISVDHFMRVAITAVTTNPDLLHADRRTLMTAMVKAAADGLLPDGREGALVVYNTEMHRRDLQTGTRYPFRVDAVQWMPMIYGIRKQMRNSGEVTRAVAEVVYKNDVFRFQRGDNAFIEHEPAPLDQEPGEIIGAYAIINLSNGEVIREVMNKAQIEAHRAKSRAPNSLMWKDFYGEGCRKTVMRVASKQAPLSPRMRTMVDREDEAPAIDGDYQPMAGILEHEAEPPPAKPAASRTRKAKDPDPPAWAVVDQDGEEHEFPTAAECANFLYDQMKGAAVLGTLEGLWESNEEFRNLLSTAGHDDIALAMAQDYLELRDAVTTKAQNAATEAAHQGGTNGAAQDTRAQDNAPSGPQSAAGAPADDEGPIPGADEPAERQSKFIAPPQRRDGKGPDWRVWSVVSFLPKVLKETDSTELAFLLGDNEPNLQQARAPGALDKDDLANLNRVIDEQQRKATVS